MAGPTKAIKNLPTIEKIEPSRIFCNAIVEERQLGTSPIKGSGIWLVDKDMHVLWMNDALQEIYGDLTHIRGGHCYEKFRGRSSKCPDCLPTKAFETGNIISGYVTRKTKDGLDRYYQLVEAPIMDEDGEVSRVLEIVSDVTEKARLEQSLRQSEAEYRALFTHAGTAVVVTDKDGYVVRVNQLYEELSGYRKEEIEGKAHYLQFIHPRDRERVKKYDEQRQKSNTKAPPSYEFIFLNRWGSERRIHICVNDLPEHGYQISSLIDLTDKWKLEQEVRSKDQFLANIMRYSVEAIVATDGDGLIRSWNRGAELMFGYKPKEIMGKRFTLLFAPEYRRKKNLAKIMNQYHKQGYLRNFVVQALAKNGDRRIINITRTSIRDEEDRELGSSAIIRDITESRRMEQRMVQQEKMRALGELAATLAHEIKNPLNSMVINMEVLKSHLTDLEGKKRDQVGRYFDVLSSEIHRLNRVMQGVTDFSRPLEGKFSKVNLSLVLSTVVELVSAQAKREKIQLEVHLPPDLPSIEGNENHLKQIFLNLLLNAFQSQPKGGKVTITAATDKQNNVTISIADKGCGIPRSQYKKVFDLYFSTKEKGSGLGLPLVKRLITTHGGKIQLKSKMKHGTTFTVSFPATR